jgi:hypothetical protein
MALTRISKNANVHAESVRVGIRLAFIANKQPVPSMELVSQQAAQRREMRRAYAIKALEVLLQKGDTGFGEENPHEKIVDQAWAIAAQMERHDNSGLMLDVVSDGVRGKN